jgi:tRNA pseudouridine synthase 10
VYEASGEWEDARHATVEIHGAGGLYIKELVSGDEGRTEPSLAGLLGVGAEVTALDVVGVSGEDEAFEDETYFRDEPRTDADTDDVDVAHEVDAEE